MTHKKRQPRAKAGAAHRVAQRLVVTGQYESNEPVRYVAHNRDGEKATARKQLVEGAADREGKPTTAEVWTVEWKGGTQAYVNPSVHFNPFDVTVAVTTGY